MEDIEECKNSRSPWWRGQLYSGDVKFIRREHETGTKVVDGERHWCLGSPDSKSLMSYRAAFRRGQPGGKRSGRQADGPSSLSVTRIDGGACSRFLSQLLEEDGTALESGGAVDRYCSFSISLEPAVHTSGGAEIIRGRVRTIATLKEMREGGIA